VSDTPRLVSGTLTHFFFLLHFLHPYICTPLLHFYISRKKVEQNFWVRPAGPIKKILVEGPGLRGGEIFEKGGWGFLDLAPPRSGWSSTKNFCLIF
jgi:hypothetical protein